MVCHNLEPGFNAMYQHAGNMTRDEFPIWYGSLTIHGLTILALDPAIDSAIAICFVMLSGVINQTI